MYWTSIPNSKFPLFYKILYQIIKPSFSDLVAIVWIPSVYRGEILQRCFPSIFLIIALYVEWRTWLLCVVEEYPPKCLSKKRRHNLNYILRQWVIAKLKQRSDAEKARRIEAKKRRRPGGQRHWDAYRFIGRRFLCDYCLLQLEIFSNLGASNKTSAYKKLFSTLWEGCKIQSTSS